MCEHCRNVAEETILGMVAQGFSLDAAIRLVRDSVMQKALADPYAVNSYEDVVKVSDDVTEAGEALAELQQSAPAAYATRVFLRKTEILADQFGENP